MKKILILTVTAGNGHNACAKGMKAKLESLGGVTVKIVDLLKTYSTKLNVWVADRGYAIAVSRLCSIYNAFYRHYRKADPNKRYSCPSQKTIFSTVQGLLEEILSFRPDVVFCTHFYGAIALTDLKLVYDLPCKTVATSLDYINSPFWEAGIGVDYFAIPNLDFQAEYLSEGFSPEQLLPVGLPVDERTLEPLDKAEARREIGLDENTFTVMVMFGGGYWSGGFKIFKQLLKALEGRHAQIIMINGKNRKSLEKVKKVRLPNGIKVLNVGFTGEVPLYLSAADLSINKGGGPGMTEIVNKSVPMLVPEKLAAQEQGNFNYMKEKGVALSYRNGKELKEKVLYLMDHPQEAEQMALRMQGLRRNAIDELARFLLALPNADYSALEEEEIELSTVKKRVTAACKKADRACRKDPRTAPVPDKHRGGVVKR